MYIYMYIYKCIYIHFWVVGWFCDQLGDDLIPISINQGVKDSIITSCSMGHTYGHASPSAKKLMGPLSKELMPLENATRCQRLISYENMQSMWNLIVTPSGPMWNQMSISLNTRASILDIQNHKQWDLNGPEIKLGEHHTRNIWLS